MYGFGENLLFPSQAIMFNRENLAMVREKLKEREKEKHRSGNWLSVSVYLVTMADHLTVRISWTINSYPDWANRGTLHPQLHG